uniref:Uncharacterized protein n=1 Tax=Arundo donax TaxID=35708 RepID=A0A0A8XYU0_ARUDO
MEKSCVVAKIGHPAAGLVGLLIGLDSITLIEQLRTYDY